MYYKVKPHYMLKPGVCAMDWISLLVFFSLERTQEDNKYWAGPKMHHQRKPKKGKN